MSLIFKIDKIDEKTYVIKDPVAHSYLLIGEERALLIDTCAGIGNIRKVVEKLTDKPVDVVNTHGHIDHIGGNGRFDRIYFPENDGEIFALHIDKKYVAGLLKKQFGGFWGAVIGVVLSFPLKRLKRFHGGEYRRIKDGHIFDLGGRTVETIETPGHTKGSVCLLDREARRLFSGDTVCDTAILLSLDGCLSPSEFLDGIKKLRKREDEFDKIYPFHRTYPVPKSYLDDYISLAEGLSNGEIQPYIFNAWDAPQFGATKGEIAIVLKNPAE
jgi:glyoxylase-like metal-dependent hydrolase (beta-lactamase superfamily II)